jgi:hypothetical protein
MLSSRTLAFVLATAACPLVMAAPPAQVPFVPSTVQRPDSHAGRFGLVTMVSYGRFGEKSTSTQVIDLDAYIGSGGKKWVVGAHAIEMLKSTPICQTPGLDGACMDTRGSSDNSGSGGAGGNLPGGGYGSSGPNVPGPTPPDPPKPGTVSWDVTSVTYTRYYDQGHWYQTTTYNRTAYPDGSGGGSDSPWSAAIINQHQAGH